MVLLPDEDSNLDKQNQNLSYYLYTIGQFETSRKTKVFQKMFRIKNGNRIYYFTSTR
jgi:hypothetical protein